MNLTIGFYAAILAVINYPFVIAIDRHVRNRPVKKIFNVEEKKGQREREIRNSWLTTPIHAILYYAFIAFGAIQVKAESVALAVASFGLTFLWTEVWHYFSHVAMHWKPLHFIHREHHLSALTGPWTSVSFSFLEKFLFSLGILGFLSAASQLHPLSAFGIFAYYVLYFYTNTLGHANFEFRQPGYYRRFMGKIFNSPTYHALHHARYIKNYGLLTPWLDRLFGTEWPDVPEIQTQVSGGDPLSKLTEKL